MQVVELNESTDVYNNDVEIVSESDLSAYSQCNKTEEEEILEEREYLRMARREEENLGDHQTYTLTVITQTIQYMMKYWNKKKIS